MSKEDNIFYRELMSQPSVLKNTVSNYLSDNRRAADLMEKFANIAGSGLSSVYFIGIGTSYYASLPYTLMANREIKSDCITFSSHDAGEFAAYLAERLNKGSHVLIIFISQSGESGEIVDILNKLQKNGFPKERIWGVTNNPDSTLGKYADLVIPLMAGEEKSVTNKTYLCTLVVLYYTVSLIGFYLNDFGDMMGVVPESDIITRYLHIIRAETGDISEEVDRILKNWDDIAASVLDFLGSDNNDINGGFPIFIDYISSGTGMAAAGQAALNTKEVAKIYSEAISAGMFRHGCIEALNPESRCIVIGNDNAHYKTLHKIIGGITERWGKGKVLYVTNEDMVEFGDRVTIIKHGVKNPYTAPIVEIVPLQILFYTLGEKRGYTPGEFLYSSKITR